MVLSNAAKLSQANGQSDRTPESKKGGSDSKWGMIGSQYSTYSGYWLTFRAMLKPTRNAIDPTKLGHYRPSRINDRCLIGIGFSGFWLNLISLS
jgi:hypothetical protein